MRIPLPLILGAALLCGQAVARNAPRPSPCHTPSMPASAWTDTTRPPGPDRGYAVLSYDLTLDIDPVAKQIAGDVQVGLVPLRSDLNRVVLDLVRNLTCDAVTGSDGALSFRHDGDSLVVFLPTAAATARAETLTIAYQGRPLPHGVFGAGFMWRTRDAGTPDDPGDDIPVIATVVEPWSAHSWWPCKDVPGDKALVSLTISVPEDLQVVANGTLTAEDTPVAGRRRFRWREAYPIAPYLVSVAITGYDSWSESCLPPVGPEVRLDYHVFGEDRQKAAYDFAPTCSMLEMMTDIAGPYPFAGEKYAQAEIKWIGAMEHQTATSISQFFLTGDRANETIIIHEMAHQWFGDSLTPASWQDIWLNEGFARYCEALWTERTYGPETYRDFMHTIGILRHPDLFAGEGILTDPDPILPNILIYNKGAWVLHLLRLLVGDETFFTFLHDYANDPDLVWGTTNTPAMIAHAEAAAGRSLAAFFTPLLETDAVPVIQAVFRLQPPTVTLTQRQKDLFELPVPVKIYTPAGSREVILDLDSRSATFALPADGPVDSLLLDPDGMTLMRTVPAAPRPLEVRGPAPNPVSGAGGIFRIFLMNQSEVVVNIYDARGHVIDSTDLGTLDATGPAGDETATPHTFCWPGSGSRPMASGIFWLRFTAGKAQATCKLTLIH